MACGNRWCIWVQTARLLERKEGLKQCTVEATGKGQQSDTVSEGDIRHIARASGNGEKELLKVKAITLPDCLAARQSLRQPRSSRVLFYISCHVSRSPDSIDRSGPYQTQRTATSFFGCFPTLTDLTYTHSRQGALRKVEQSMCWFEPSKNLVGFRFGCGPSLSKSELFSVLRSF